MKDDLQLTASLVPSCEALGVFYVFMQTFFFFFFCKTWALKETFYTLKVHAHYEQRTQTRQTSKNTASCAGRDKHRENSGQNKDAETQSGHKHTLRDGGLVHDSVIDDGEKWRTQTLFFSAGSLSFWGSSVPDFRNHRVLKKNKQFGVSGGRMPPVSPKPGWESEFVSGDNLLLELLYSKTIWWKVNFVHNTWSNSCWKRELNNFEWFKTSFPS